MAGMARVVDLARGADGAAPAAGAPEVRLVALVAIAAGLGAARVILLRFVS